MSQLELHRSENKADNPYANGGIFRTNVTNRYGKKEEVIISFSEIQMTVMKAPNPVNVLSMPSHISLWSPLNLEVAELNRPDVSDAKAPIFSPIMAAMVLTVELICLRDLL